MSQYMLLVYEEEVDPAEQAEREQVTPMLVELHAGLREAGLLVGVQRLRSSESATSVRVRDAWLRLDAAGLGAARVGSVQMAVRAATC